MPVFNDVEETTRPPGREALLRVGLDALGEGIALFDRDLVLVYCNRPFMTLFGLPAELCRPGAQLAALLQFAALRGDYGPGDAAVLVPAELAEFAARSERQSERERDGRWLATRHRPLAGGGLLLTCTDITDMRRTEAALRASEERYALVTEASTEGFYDWDVVEDTLYVSPQLNRLFDFEAGRLRSQTWNDRIIPEDYQGYRQTLIEYFTQRTDRLQCEYRIRVKSGEVRWIKDRAHAIRRSDGRAIRLVGAVSDITHEKQVQQALMASEDRYARALDAVNESIYDWNIADDTVFYSARILALFGRTRDDLKTPQDWLRLVHPDDLAD